MNFDVVFTLFFIQLVMLQIKILFSHTTKSRQEAEQGLSGNQSCEVANTRIDD
jgi:hypothetical protein